MESRLRILSPNTSRHHNGTKDTRKHQGRRCDKSIPDDDNWVDESISGLRVLCVFVVNSLGYACSFAARSVLCNSIVIVIGPTPPGTGVSADATPRTDSKSTSPTRVPSASTTGAPEIR